jgi:hypothetical protein
MSTASSSVRVATPEPLLGDLQPDSGLVVDMLGQPRLERGSVAERDHVGRVVGLGGPQGQNSSSKLTSPLTPTW